MATSAVSPVIYLVVSLIRKELQLLDDFPRVFESLQAEHRRMQCFLKDSAADQDHVIMRAEWISQIREQTFYAEDLIDTYLFDRESKTVRRGLTLIGHEFKQWRYKHKITREIKDITNKLLQSPIPPANQLPPQPVPFPNYALISGIVGLQTETDYLLRQITGAERRTERTVVSIVGMGGIGKSTLAWQAFHHSDVESTYDIRAWVSISRISNYRDVQMKILSNLGSTEEREELASWRTERLEKLSGSLRGKCYLVVLDDVWGSPHHSPWDDGLLDAFPDEQNGSRILITTRMNDLALYAGPHSPSLMMKHLDDEKSWELFSKRASIGTNDRVFQPIGKKILKQCGGLPLSIVSMGETFKGVARRRADWENKFKEMQGCTLQDEVLKTLERSYHDLTPELQRCFLHMGFFPLNNIISTRKLILLWIAEGLIYDHEGGGIEAIAESHLEMLVEKSMVQPVEFSPDGRIKACRIDTSLHELSIMKAKKEILLEIHQDDKFSPSSYTRHQAVHHSSERYLDSQIVSSKLRSLMFFVPNGRLSVPQSEFMCKRFKLLKLLHLEGMIVGRLPEKIGNLRNLRYLNLRNTSIDKLQPSMSNLKKLLTLDIRDNMYVTGLDVIKDMTNLQNLYLPGNYEGLEFDGLSQLRVLKFVKLASTKSLESLVRLTTLHIQLDGQLSLDDFLESARNLKELVSLHLYPFIEITSLDTDNFKLLTSLTKLYIKGGVRELPSPDNFPPNLMQLTLDGSGLIPFPLDELAKLPKLSILRLRNLFIKDEKLSFSSAGFLRLKYLELLHLWNLNDLELQGKGALGRLRHLKISNCTALNSLPKEMKQLTKLSELHIDKMREAFEQKIQKGGEDHETVRHVSSIIYTNTLRSHEVTPNVHLVDPSYEKELDKVKMKKEELNAYGNVPPTQPQQQQQQQQQKPHPDSHEVFKDRFKSISARLGDTMVELISLACETNQHYPTPDGLKVGLPQIIANACRTLSDCKQSQSQSQSHPLSSQSEESNKDQNASMLDNDSITRPSLDNSDHPRHSHVPSTTISPSITISYLCDAEKSFSNSSNKNGCLALTIVQHQSAKQQTPSHIGSKKYKGNVQEKDEQSRATNLIFLYPQKHCYYLGITGAQEDDKFVVDYVFITGRLMLFHDDGNHHIMNAWAKAVKHVENKNRKGHTRKRLFLTRVRFVTQKDAVHFQELIEEFPVRDPGTIPSVSRMLELGLHPEDSGYAETKDIESCLGRPPDQPAPVRNRLSYLEHITQEYGQNGTSVPNSSSMGVETLNNKGNHNKYLECYVDVKSDGNCGFRVVADWMMNDQEKWRDIREKMANEVETKRNHYSSMEINVEEALTRLRWYHGDCDSKYWMLAYEDLIPIANLNNAVVMLFTVDENDRVSPYLTILPTYAPLKVTGPTRELAIGHIAHKQHYIHLKMKKDCPIPPVYPYWSTWCNDNVRHWDALYQSRVQK